MPKSSRHKSHKQSKHSSRDYSDSEEDVVKTKEKRSRDDVSTRGRKTSSLLRDGKDNQDPSGHGNGDILEEYVSSKRRKEKTDVNVGGDRWNGGGEERMDSERRVEKELHKGESLDVDVKLKENNNKGESLRVESKSKSKRHDSGTAGERKEDSLVSVGVAKEENKTKGESRRKSERDSSSRKGGKESKDKDRRSEKEKNGGQDTKSGDAEVKLVDVDVGKKQGAQLVDLSTERQSRKYRENNERTSLDELKNPGLDKDIDKKVRKKVGGSNEREKYYDESKENDGRRVSSKGDHMKDSKHKDGGYPDKYQEDSRKDGRRRDDKYWEEDDRDNKHHDEKYLEDGERDSRRRDDRHRGDGDRDGRHKDEKQRDDGEWGCRRKNDKYHEVIERDGKYHEDSDRDYRHKDDRNHEDVDKDIRRGDGKYYEDGDRDDRCRDDSYRDDFDRDYRHRDEKYCEDIERDVRYKDSKQGGEFDRKKRPRDSKYRDERASRDRTGDKSDSKRSRDDGYAPDHHVRKSSAHDDSPTHDDRAARYRDDQGRRRNNEKEDYSDVKSRGSNDQRSDAEKKSAGSRRMDPVTDRVRSTSRNVDVELTSGHGRRRSSPTSSSYAPRDNYRAAKQDDSKFREYNYEDRSLHNMNFTSRSLEKQDIRSPPLKVLQKSPSSSFDRRQLTRPETRRNIDFDESTQRSGGSRDFKDVHPAEELVPANADTISVSSPSAKNSHLFSSNSKSFPPPTPSFRTDNPSLLGSGDKPNMRSRRIGDHNMGRMQVNQNNAWRSVPSWPSPVPNGFLPFPPASPFHSVMQPFHPPMFGVGPSMELNHHHSPYHIFGRPEWDHTRNMSGGLGWETGKDLSKGPNRNVSLEMMENNNNSIRSGDEDALGGQSVQTPQNEKTRVDQQSESVSDVVQSTKGFGNNEIGVIVSSGDSGDVDKVLKKDDVPFCHFYLSQLDISAELAESELYDKCPGLIDTDELMCCGVDDSKILYMEGVEDKMAPISLFASTDDSVFEKSITLYKIQKEIFLAETGEKPKAILNSDQEDKKVQEVITEKLCTAEATHVVEDTTKTLQENINGLPSNVTTEKPKEPVSAMDLQIPEEGSDGPIDTEYGPLLNSDVSSEAMKLEWVNLSRIHHSPENTH